MSASQSTLAHATLTLNRRYPASVQRVWKAFEDPTVRAIWAAPSDDATVRFDRADFQVGGVDETVCVIDGEDAYLVDDRYYALAEPSRLVFTETIAVPGALLGVCLCSVELSPDGDGTRLTLTVQTTALDGSGLEMGVGEGWGKALDNLENLLQA